MSKINEEEIYSQWRDSHQGVITEANADFIEAMKAMSDDTKKFVTTYTTASGEVIFNIAKNADPKAIKEFNEKYNNASKAKDEAIEASFSEYKLQKIQEQETVTIQRVFNEETAKEAYQKNNAAAKQEATENFEKSLKKMSLSEKNALKKAGFSYTVDSDGNVNINYSAAGNLSDREKEKLNKTVNEVKHSASSSFSSYQKNQKDYLDLAEESWYDKYNTENNNLTCNISKADAEKYWNENFKDKQEADVKKAYQDTYAAILADPDLDDATKAAVSIGPNGKLKVDKSKLTKDQLDELNTSYVSKCNNNVLNIKNKYELEYNDGLGKAVDAGYINEAGEDINNKMTDPNALDNDIKGSTSADSDIDIGDSSVDSSSNEVPAVEGGATPAAEMYVSWDPRLYRIDSFILNDSATGLGGIALNAQIPFGSHTVNSTFYDYGWNMEKALKDQWDKNKGKNKGKSKSAALNASTYANYLDKNESTNNKTSTSNVSAEQLGSMSQKRMVNDVTDFQDNSDFYGAASLMNAYTLTKLVGGLDVNMGSKTLKNYMFDIRDLRRFYDSGVEGNKKEDLHASSNPTVSLLINWGNSDRWGRTPYSYQDFVFSEWFGKIPNNRLITLRRYTAPTYDNLNFENMYGEIEDANHTKILDPVTEGTGSFAPVATVVTYFGGDTGNALSSLMNFTTGTKWKDITADVYTVDGDEGSNPQAVVDLMLESNTGFGGQGAAQEAVNGLLGVFGNVAGRVVSFGKMTMAMKDNVGINEELQMRMYGALNDPYDGIYKNRILGPINRIQSVLGRDAGIEFSLNFSIICSYKSKAIGGINPKAALLDVLGNCMAMASPQAVFWGGAYRFNVIPHAYPFHDGGWRDSFMKKIYDGKLLGNDGAIATLASGIKNVCSDENGNFSVDSLTSKLGSLMGDGLAILGSAINSVTAMFGGSGNAGDFLTSAASSLNNKTEEDNKKMGQNAVGKLFGNLENMWHNKALKASTLPRLKSNGSILTGEPTGEWHLTIGNPLNPIMVVGNLICKSMSVTWDDELGPDDFPTGFKVTYTVEHAMARDSDAIQSMFNRGMGKFYVLPDYIQFSSDRMSHVDKFTQDDSKGDTGQYNYLGANLMGALMQEQGVPTHGYNSRYNDPGTKPTNSGNYDTQLITKFTPVSATSDKSISSLRGSKSLASNLTVIASKAVNRKLALP